MILFVNCNRVQSDKTVFLKKYSYSRCNTFTASSFVFIFTNVKVLNLIMSVHRWEYSQTTASVSVQINTVHLHSHGPETHTHTHTPSFSAVNHILALFRTEAFTSPSWAVASAPSRPLIGCLSLLRPSAWRRPLWPLWTLHVAWRRAPSLLLSADPQSLESDTITWSKFILYRQSMQFTFLNLKIQVAYTFVQSADQLVWSYRFLYNYNFLYTVWDTVLYITIQCFQRDFPFLPFPKCQRNWKWHQPWFIQSHLTHYLIGLPNLHKSACKNAELPYLKWQFVLILWN